MSLTDEAVTAISSYRETILRTPAAIEEERRKLQRTLTELGRRDNNVFYSVDAQSFANLPSGERFDREQYLCFRYLFEPTYRIRRVLVKQKRSQLQAMAEALLNSQPNLAQEFERTHNSFNFDAISKRTELKAEAQFQGISSSKHWFTIKKALENPKGLHIDQPDNWCRPNQYKSELHQEFKRSCKEIGMSWGMSSKLLNYYIAHIELKKTAEKAAVISAVAGGAVLAAWGLSRAIQASGTASSGPHTLAGTAAMGIPGVAIAGAGQASQPLTGLENYPQFLSMPSNPLMANQGAFLHYLQNRGGTNAYDLQIAMLNRSAEQQRATQQIMADALTRQYDYGLTGQTTAESLSTALGSSLGSLLGVPANLTFTDFGDQAARITGHVRGHTVNANIFRNGNMTTITSY